MKKSLVTKATRSWILFCLGVVSTIGMQGCAIFGSTEIQAQKADGYGIAAPKQWVPKDKGDGDYAYRLPSGSIVSLNSSCNRHLDVGLDVLTRQLLIGSRNVHYFRTDKMQIDKDDGLLTKVDASYEGVPFHLLLFVLRGQKCIFDFSLVSPKVVSSEEEQDFINFIKSFRYGKP